MENVVLRLCLTNVSLYVMMNIHGVQKDSYIFYPALYLPDLVASFDYHLLRLMTRDLFTSYEDAINWVHLRIASKYEAFFFRILPESWEQVVASVGQFKYNKRYRSFTISTACFSLLNKRVINKYMGIV